MVRSGQELALIAMKKEFIKLTATHTKAKAEADGYLNVGTEMLAIHSEFAEIVKSKETGKSTIAKLDKLQKRRAAADKIRAKDFLKLCDKENESQFEAQNLLHEIQMLEWKLKKH